MRVPALSGPSPEALFVQLVFDEIIITMPGTAFKVIYKKIPNPPGLIVKSERIPDDRLAPVPKREFLALARIAANDKARELGWIV
jgi:hypothetical protein